MVVGRYLIMLCSGNGPLLEGYHKKVRCGDTFESYYKMFRNSLYNTRWRGNANVT